MRTGPPEAACCVCMKLKKCKTRRWVKSIEAYRTYENFFYSEEHRGWICKSCSAIVSKAISKPRSKDCSGQLDFFRETR